MAVKDGIALSIINACASNSGYIPSSQFCSQNLTKVFAYNLKKGTFYPHMLEVRGRNNSSNTLTFNDFMNMDTRGGKRSTTNLRNQRTNS